MPVLSVRVSEKEAQLIQTIAKEEDKEKSSEARELMMDGIRYKLLLSYKQGKLSIGMLAKKLGIPLSEAIDLLAFFGIASPISYSDYLQGLDTTDKLFS